jgi:hypothetical protein
MQNTITTYNITDLMMSRKDLNKQLSCDEVCLILNMMMDEGAITHCYNVLEWLRYKQHHQFCPDCIRTYKRLFRLEIKDFDMFTQLGNYGIPFTRAEIIDHLRNGSKCSATFIANYTTIDREIALLELQNWRLYKLVRNLLTEDEIIAQFVRGMTRIDVCDFDLDLDPNNSDPGDNDGWPNADDFPYLFKLSTLDNVLDEMTNPNETRDNIARRYCEWCRNFGNYSHEDQDARVDAMRSAYPLAVLGSYYRISDAIRQNAEFTPEIVPLDLFIAVFEFSDNKEYQEEVNGELYDYFTYHVGINSHSLQVADLIVTRYPRYIPSMFVYMPGDVQYDLGKYNVKLLRNKSKSAINMILLRNIRIPSIARIVKNVLDDTYIQPGNRGINPQVLDRYIDIQYIIDHSDKKDGHKHVAAHINDVIRINIGEIDRKITPEIKLNYINDNFQRAKSEIILRNVIMIDPVGRIKSQDHLTNAIIMMNDMLAKDLNLSRCIDGVSFIRVMPLMLRDYRRKLFALSMLYIRGSINYDVKTIIQIMIGGYEYDPNDTTENIVGKYCEILM